MVCEICRSFPHRHGCPEADTPPIVYYCDECKEPIYDGCTFYRIGESKYCEDCMDNFKEYAEIEEVNWEVE